MSGSRNPGDRSRRLRSGSLDSPHEEWTPFPTRDAFYDWMFSQLVPGFQVPSTATPEPAPTSRSRTRTCSLTLPSEGVEIQGIVESLVQVPRQPRGILRTRTTVYLPPSPSKPREKRVKIDLVPIQSYREYEVPEGQHLIHRGSQTHRHPLKNKFATVVLVHNKTTNKFAYTPHQFFQERLFFPFRVLQIEPSPAETLRTVAERSTREYLQQLGLPADLPLTLFHMIVIQMDDTLKEERLFTARYTFFLQVKGDVGGSDVSWLTRQEIREGEDRLTGPERMRSWAQTVDNTGSVDSLMVDGSTFSEILTFKEFANLYISKGFKQTFLQEMCEYARVTRADLKAFYFEFLYHSFPSLAMTFLTFNEFMDKIAFFKKEDELNVTGRTGTLTLQDMELEAA